MNPVAYTFISFPKITETFHLREVIELRRQGIPLIMFSLLKKRSKDLMHPEAKPLLEFTRYGPWFFSWPLWISNFYFLSRRPLRYLRLFLRLIFVSLRQPILCLKTLAIFPKSVYFARLAERLTVGHIHATFASHNATAAFIMSELSGIPYSVSVHAYDIFSERSLHSLQFSKARFVVAISNFNRALIRRRYGEAVSAKTYLVRCGVDLELFRPRADQARGEAKDFFRILCVAALRPEKGHRFLLEALHALKLRGKRIQCILIGEGPMRRRLEEAIREFKIGGEVVLEGEQTQQEVLNWLQKADCFVLASTREAIPVSLMEAMASQLPVVAPRLSTGMDELVQDGENGILFTSGDASALGSAIAGLMENPELARNLGDEARKTIEGSYNLKSNVAQLRELFLRGSHLTGISPRRKSRIPSRIPQFPREK